jgi:alkylation response protein AidB-like acyl-CoA dehydrogenase
MDFGFSAEQEMLRQSARRFLETECSSAVVRAALGDATAHVPALWARIAELGWLGILVPAEYGGLGGDFLDMTVILEESGRTLLPGPFFATAILGALALREAGSAEQKARLLPALAQGALRLTLALGEGDDPYDPAGIRLRAASRDGGWVLGGEAPFVMDAHVADSIVVAARTADGATAGVTLFLVDARAPGVAIAPLQTVDMTRRLCGVRFRDVALAPAAVLGAPGAGAPHLRRVLDHALSAIATELVGVGQRALELSVTYANTRTQFGRPIGSFQAVKHKCVDMMVAVENARSLAYYGAWTVSENAPEAGHAVPMAKAACAEMGKAVTSEAIQVHGGIGFTWEHDLHLYYRRALASDAAFGTTPVHREAIARALEF